MPPIPRRRRLGWYWPLWAVALGLCGALAIGPRAIEATAALEWTKWHAAKSAAAARPGREIREAAHAAARGVDRGTPFPAAAEAVRIVLRTARATTDRDAGAAGAAVREITAALERANGGLMRGLGLGGVLEEARQFRDAR